MPSTTSLHAGSPSPSSPSSSIDAALAEALLHNPLLVEYLDTTTMKLNVPSSANSTAAAPVFPKVKDNVMKGREDSDLTSFRSEKPAPVYPVPARHSPPPALSRSNSKADRYALKMTASASHLPHHSAGFSAHHLPQGDGGAMNGGHLESSLPMSLFPDLSRLNQMLFQEIDRHERALAAAASAQRDLFSLSVCQSSLSPTQKAQRVAERRRRRRTEGRRRPSASSEEGEGDQDEDVSGVLEDGEGEEQEEFTRGALEDDDGEKESCSSHTSGGEDVPPNGDKPEQDKVEQKACKRNTARASLSPLVLMDESSKSAGNNLPPSPGRSHSTATPRTSVLYSPSGSSPIRTAKEERDASKHVIVRQDEWVFLKAALELLEEKAKSNPRAAATRAGLASDTIFTGYLKTSKESPIPMFSQKFVVLTHGKITYYEDVTGPITRGSKKKVIPLDQRSLCRAVNSQRFQGKHVFEVLSGDSEGRANRRLWMAKSEEERALWITAIHRAMNPASSILDAPKSTDLDVKNFLETQAAIRAAESRREYLTALAILRSGLYVPVEWVHEQSASYPRETCDIAQLFKDLKRDTVEINQTRYDGSEGLEFIIGAFTRYILDCDKKIHQRLSQQKKSSGGGASGSGGGRGGPESPGSKLKPRRPLTEAAALGFAREVLLACNRTQSGGDAYDTVDLLCRNMDLVVLCPSGSEAAPLRITISIVEIDVYDEGESWVSRKSGIPPTASRTGAPHQDPLLSSSPHPISAVERADMPRSGDGAGDVSSPSSQKHRRSRSLGQHHFRLPEHSAFGSGNVPPVISETSDRLRLESLDPSVTTSLRVGSSERKGIGGGMHPLQRENSYRRAHKDLQIQVKAEACTSYKICPIDPQDDTADSTWAYVDAYFEQSYHIGVLSDAVSSQGMVKIVAKLPADNHIPTPSSTPLLSMNPSAADLIIDSMLARRAEQSSAAMTGKPLTVTVNSAPAPPAPPDAGRWISPSALWTAPVAAVVAAAAAVGVVGSGAGAATINSGVNQGSSTTTAASGSNGTLTIAVGGTASQSGATATPPLFSPISLPQHQQAYSGPSITIPPSTAAVPLPSLSVITGGDVSDHAHKANVSSITSI